MATIAKTASNRYNFFRLRRVTNGTTSNIPVCQTA